MTFAPQTLKDLAAFYTSTMGGVNLGIVGDQRHTAKGVSYHLGKSQLVSGAYSAVTARDRAGLSEAASAIDLGKLNGSYDELRRFSIWLANQCLAGAPGTNDIREVIFSPDGKVVLGFKDGIDRLIPNYSDNSHFGHTHISYYRDSEGRDKRAIFAAYGGGGDMGEFVVPFAKPLAFAVTGSARSFDASPPYAELSAVSGATQAEAAVYISQPGAPHGAFVRIVTGATGRRLVAAASGTLGEGAVDCKPALAAAKASDKATVTAAIVAATDALRKAGLF